MTKRGWLLEVCNNRGFTFATWSPGDRVTRYRFFPGIQRRNYFEGYGDYTALGYKEAYAYAMGRVHGNQE